MNPYHFSIDTLTDGFAAFDGGITGYDALKTENRRKRPTHLLRSEDAEANDAQRRLLVSGHRDVARNFTILAWMVRRHQDYVTTFTFKGATGNKALDKKLEDRITWWNKRENFDVAGRHGLKKALRIAEGRRTIDGDVLAVRMRDGRTQWIEGDRIRPGLGMSDALGDAFDITKMVHGVKINEAGRAKGYAISRRGRSGIGDDSNFFFERMVSAQNAYLHGYFERFDQVRGVSPITTAINELRDTYEALDLARAKMKVAQLFALAFYRDFAEGEEPAADKTSAGGYDVDFGKGPAILDMDIGERAEFLESHTPSNETQSFCELVIQIALKALDFPYSFFNESFTNYSGSRGALQQYDRSAETKRDDNRSLLDWLTGWRFLLDIQDGELPGVDPNALRWQWIATGMPWIDPLKEVLANVQEIGAGMNSRTRVLAERGLVFEDIVAELTHEAKLLRDAGLPLNLDQSNALIHALTTDTEKANSKTVAA